MDPIESNVEAVTGVETFIVAEFALYVPFVTITPEVIVPLPALNVPPLFTVKAVVPVVRVKEVFVRVPATVNAPSVPEAGAFTFNVIVAPVFIVTTSPDPGIPPAPVQPVHTLTAPTGLVPSQFPEVSPVVVPQTASLASCQRRVS